MKIIHCADLHLDSRMTSNLKPDKARIRKNEILGTFSDMLKFASQSGVDAIIIAGDMFDTRRVSAKTQEFVISRIKEYRDIEFLVLSGNHDEENFLFSLEDKPANLFIFTEENRNFRFGNICITGLNQSSGGAQGVYQSLSLLPDDVNIVVMHGQESRTAEEDTVCIPLLRNKNIDYLALGHIHGYKCEKLDARGEYCYSGCLEGRGFDECGEKGFVLLEIKENKVTHNFIPFAKRRIYEIDVSLTGAETFSDIEKVVTESVENIPEESLVKVILSGDISGKLNTDSEFILSKLTERFFFAAVSDRTKVKINPEEYENDISLKGEFIRYVTKSNLDEEEKNAIIITGLRALRGEELI